MSERPAYFVVQKFAGLERPAIYWDELPREPLRNLVYVVRLDQLPGATSLTGQPTTWLYRVFCHLRRKGMLPPRYEPPPRKTAEKPVAKAGHREPVAGVRLERAREAARVAAVEDSLAENL